MITPDGTAKLLDWGLACLHDDVQANDDGVEFQEELTRVGATVGTSEYRSPEQTQDCRRSDIRSDLYSLGCTLYELLTGGPPFLADNPVELMMKHAKEKPTSIPGLDEQLAGILDKLLAKNPSDRFQFPIQLLETLHVWKRVNPTQLRSRPANTSDGEERLVTVVEDDHRSSQPPILESDVAEGHVELETETVILHKQQDVLRSEREVLEKQRNVLLHEQDQLSQAATELRETLAAQQADLQIRMRDLEASRQDVLQQEQAVRDQETALATQQDTFEAETARTQTNSQKQKRILGALGEQLEQERAALNSEREMFQSQQASHAKSVREMEEQQAQMSSQTVQLQAVRDSLDKECNQLNVWRPTLEKDQDQLHARREQCRTDRQQLNDQLVQFEKDSVHLDQQQQHVSMKANDLETQSLELAVQREQFAAEQSKLFHEREQIRVDSAELSKQQIEFENTQAVFEAELMQSAGHVQRMQETVAELEHLSTKWLRHLVKLKS